jgi:hypothetical protein
MSADNNADSSATSTERQESNPRVSGPDWKGKGFSDMLPADVEIPSPGTKAQTALNIPIFGNKPELSFEPSSPVDQPPASFFHSDNLVTLLVGPEEEEMVVHKTYLTQSSAFFKAVMKKEWPEGRSFVIRLPEELPELIQHYVEYLYGGKPPSHTQAHGSEWSDGSHQYELLAHLYSLGERYLDGEYRNAILREFLKLTTLEIGPQKIRFFPGTQCINIIYQGTTTNSPARRMMVDFAVAHSTNTWFDERMNAAYLLDFSRAMHLKVMDQQFVRDFRKATMNADDYLVSEET